MRFSFKTYRGRLQFVQEILAGKAWNVLDVGNLGDGTSTNMQIKETVEKAGGTYTGLDSNEPLTKKLNLPKQVIGDLHHAPFPDASFDAVYAGEIIEHTWTPGVMIQECRRILRPGGRLILDTPNPYAITTILRFLLRRENDMGDNRTLTFHEAKSQFSELKEKGQVLLQPQHKIFFTPAMLRQLLEMHGFVLESIGVTAKARGMIVRFLLLLFPHAGSHLCIVARKATLEDAFADVLSPSSPSA